MTFPLTPTVIMLDLSPPDSDACTGTALPINLSHRESRPFQPWRLTHSRRTAIERRPRAPTNRLPLTRANPAPNATATEPWPLSP